MAFDPNREDFQRLSLRLAQSLDGADPMAAARAYAGFARRFAQDRDSLPQTDADRAFHLVAEATRLIDYELPFATDEEAETIISHGHRLLEEALSLDRSCYDALRMDAASRCPSFESYYDWLCEHEPEVRAHCAEARAQAERDSSDERAAVAAQVALYPHLRWLAMMAAKALICGRNRETLRLCNEALRLDPADAADVRFTAALAYAKLEDEQGLDQLEAQCRALGHPQGTQDAWMLLARMALAHKRANLPLARQALRRLVERYPNAVVSLVRQREYPDGVFARLPMAPLSEDELVIALSEGTVLLQEGRDTLGRGSLGTWVLQESLALATPRQMDELRDDLAELARTQGGLAEGAAS